MGEQTEKGNFQFIKPVDQLPIRTKQKSSFYAGIIDEFAQSGLKYAMVNQMNKKTLSVYVGLRLALKKRGIRNIKVCQIKNQIYLKKLG